MLQTRKCNKTRFQWPCGLRGLGCWLETGSPGNSSVKFLSPRTLTESVKRWFVFQRNIVRVSTRAPAIFIIVWFHCIPPVEFHVEIGQDSFLTALLSNPLYAFILISLDATIYDRKYAVDIASLIKYKAPSYTLIEIRPFSITLSRSLWHFIRSINASLLCV
jgi:hypothetical protein